MLISNTPTFAFYIIHFGSESNTFGHLAKSFFKVFVMIHGEFEFEDLWRDSDDRLENPAVKVFTMLLLVGTILFGSLIMVKRKVTKDQLCLVCIANIFIFS